MRIKVAALVFVAVAATNAYADTRLAIELVTVARFDYALLFGSQLAVQRKAEIGEIPRKASDCFADHPPSAVTEPLAVYLAEQLTDDELREAISFYGSEVGRKYTQHGIVSFYRHYNVPTTIQLPSLSERETEMIAAFSKTGAGNKLIFKQIVRAGATSEPVVWVFRKLRHACNLR